MTTTEPWFVLAGFLLGFTASTLWEWFHFRKERMKARDRRVAELEAKVRELEEGASFALATETQPSAAPGYRSPGVFLETEEAPAILPPVSQAVMARPDAVTAPANASVEAIALRSTEQRVAGQAGRPMPPVPLMPPVPGRSEVVSVRRRGDLTPLSVRREVLRRGPRPVNPSAPAASGLAAAMPQAAERRLAWVDDPRLTEPAQDYPDNLSKVKGIGEVYRQRLYRAGIFTWHQVATTDVARLRQATHAYPSSNVEEWPAQAQQLAEKHRRVDAVYTGPLPDELTKIVGIGPVSAQALYRAGVCTYEQLAVMPVEELGRLFPIAVAGDQPDFHRWIEQAIVLANAKHTP